MHSRLALIAVAVCAVTLTGCAEPEVRTDVPRRSQAAASATPSASPTPANPVIERINNLTDCAELQREFDQAEANRKLHDAGSPLAVLGTEYMKAANARMEEVGCYGD